MENYSDTIKKVQELLLQNTEWKDRYKGYIEKLDDNTLDRFNKAQKRFTVPQPFHLYMPLSMAINRCSEKHTSFELRFHGQSVGELKIDHEQNDEVTVKIKVPDTIKNALEQAGMKTEAKKLQQYRSEEYLKWSGEKAKDLRKIYLDLESRIQADENLRKSLGQPEHDMECELLKNFSKKSSDGKEICSIQPVMIKNTNARFQMPTPLKASEAKKGTDHITYANQGGGGIDILARVGSGRGATLAVLELKDSYEKNEPPEKVIHQAVAYAAFICELLRSKCGGEWWKFFGFGRDIPKKLEIKAIAVMPDHQGADVDFGRKELAIGNDIIRLGYIYRSTGNTKFCF